MSNSNKPGAPNPFDIFQRHSGAGKELGMGGVFGFASGLASRYILKYALLITGFSYLTLQALSQSGYISVNWEKINQQFKDQLDLNKDGKINAEDAKIFYNQYMMRITQGIPSTLGFATCFLLGFKRFFIK